MKINMIGYKERKVLLTVEMTPSEDIGDARASRKEADGESRLAYLGYTCIFSILFAFLYITNKEQLFSWGVLALNVVWLSLRWTPVLPLLSSFLVPNEFAAFGSVVAWMLLAVRRKGEKARELKVDRPCLILIILIVANSVFQIPRLGTASNLIAYGCYIGLIVCMGIRAYQTVSKGALLRAIECCAVAEIVVSALIVVKYGWIPGDVHYGTFGNAHYCGLICALMLIVLVWSPREADVRFTAFDAVLCLGLGIVVFLSDSKAVVGAGLICFAILLMLRLARQGSFDVSGPLIWTVLIITALTFALSFVIYSDGFRRYAESEAFPLRSFFSSYVYFDGLGTNKFEYMAGTLSEMSENGRLLSGYGLGEYGSRFANLFGYGHTYRQASALNDFVASHFESHMIPEYISWASKYDDAAADAIGGFSAVLSYPFNSFIAYIAETGLLGLALLMRVLRKAQLGWTAQIALAFFFGSCMTDLYLDHIQSIGIVVVIAAVYAGSRTMRVPCEMAF